MKGINRYFENYYAIALCSCSLAIIGSLVLLYSYYKNGNKQDDKIKSTNSGDATIQIEKKGDEFIDSIKKFKKENNIHSLRRDVFGISLDSNIQKEILDLRQNFFNIEVVRERISKIQITNASQIQYLNKYEKIILQLITNEDLRNYNNAKNYNTFEYLAKNQKVGDNLTKIMDKWAQLNQIPAVAQFAHKDDRRSIFLAENRAILSRSNGYVHIPFQCRNALANSQDIINEVVIGKNLKNNCIINYAISNKSGKLMKFNNQSYNDPSLYARLIALQHTHLNITFNFTQSKWDGCSGEYHVSIFVSYKLDEEVKVISVDAYHFESYVYSYKSDKSFKTHFVKDVEGTALQTVSWFDTSCGIYSANIANILIEKLSKIHDKNKWENIITNPSTYYELKQYFDNDCNIKKDHVQYHNNIRCKIAYKFMEQYMHQRESTITL